MKRSFSDICAFRLIVNSIFFINNIPLNINNLLTTYSVNMKKLLHIFAAIPHNMKQPRLYMLVQTKFTLLTLNVISPIECNIT